MALKEHYELFTLAQEETLEWLQEQVVGLRTGRVTAALVEHIPVEHYGTKTPLNGLASISNSDARTLAVSPWDAGAVDAVAKALTEADLGANPNVEGDVIRLVFPSMTEEAREHTLKQLHGKAEEARVRLRQARDEALRAVKTEKEQGELTEDDFYDGKKQLDEMIDGANKQIEDVVTRKEADINTV